MKYRLRITTVARQELLSQTEWYAQTSHSWQIAEQWYSGFIDLLAMLAENPFRGALVQDAEEFPFELRQISYGSGKRLTHRAYYRIAGDLVEVLAIRHAAQRPLSSEDIND